MDHILTTQSVSYFVGAVGILFGVYRYFKEPQVRTERKDAVQEVHLQMLKERVDMIYTNHLPHIQARLDDIHEDLAKYEKTTGEQLVKLATIIDERIPKKT